MAEREELEELLVFLDKDSHRVRSAAISEISRLRDGASINVRTASKGSIVIEILVVGLAIWALDKTLGKTVEDAWTKSDLHRQLVDLLSVRVFKKRDAIARQLEFTYSKKRLTQRIERPEDRPELIVVIAPTDKSKPLPTPSEQFDKNIDRE